MNKGVAMAQVEQDRLGRLERIQYHLSMIQAEGEALAKPTETPAAGVWLETVRVLHSGQKLLQALRTLAIGHADRAGAAPKGMRGFLASECGLAPGQARGQVETARRVTQFPVVTAKLAEGTLEADQVRVLSYAVKAVKGSDV